MILLARRAGLSSGRRSSRSRRGDDNLPTIMPVDRREFLKLATVAGAGCLAGFDAHTLARSLSRQTASAKGLWAEADAILRRIVPPTFPNRTFDITRFGARETDSTQALRRAIDACHAAGGGPVIAPKGRWVAGPIVLQSKVNLHLEDGATIAFSRDPRAYLPVVFTRREGAELMNYSPFIYAFQQSNIAITGTGTLDGQADAEHWWPWTREASDSRTRLRGVAARGVAVAERLFGDGSSLRGGTTERVAMRDVKVGEVAGAIVAVDFYYEEGDKGDFTPIVRDIDVRGVTSRKSKYAFLLRGYARSPVSNVTVTDCTFDGVEKEDVLENVRGLVLANVRVNGTLRNERISH